MVIHGSNEEKAAAQQKLHTQFGSASSMPIVLTVEAVVNAREDMAQQLDTLQNHIDNAFASSDPQPPVRRVK